MSQYISTQELDVKDLDSLVRALEHLGYVVERHAEPVRLRGYRGDLRAQRAHVVVRKEHTKKAASNDVGWELVDGRVVSHISQYDKSVGFDESWRRALVRECGVQRAVARALRAGHRVVRKVDAKGRPRLEMMVR